MKSGIILQRIPRLGQDWHGGIVAMDAFRGEHMDLNQLVKPHQHCLIAADSTCKMIYSDKVTIRVALAGLGR
jgi:hypothetical protein